MAKSLVTKKAGFGTLEVFVTSVSTILGAVLFLYFGSAVGNLGFFKVLAVILIGHLVTFPTAFAVAEIATNQRVLGGGAYFIISRSFGLNIGAAVGISLYFSQAISVAFYIMALAEALAPTLDYFQSTYGFTIPEVWRTRIISIPAMSILALIVILRGANVGMKALYGVAILLGVAIIMFLFGEPDTIPETNALRKGVDNPERFFMIFALVFPAFTGLAAGLGLSGDLKDPQVAIPRGTILATLVGAIIYIAVSFKFAISASPDQLVNNPQVMQNIAIWGPIIPIGLAAASISSAIGSILVAPRTLQAIGADDILPNKGLNRFFARLLPSNAEPRNASILSVIIAFVFIAIDEIEKVAEVISMFFMVTYGAICLVSLLEHFAADPSYRPKFRSHWFISLIGTIFSFWLMFKMKAGFASLALLVMGIIYYIITAQSNETKGFVKLFKGVIFQLSRQLQILAQRANRGGDDNNWRPFAICISKDTFVRRSAYDMLRWLSYKYGFGTYIHYIEGYLSKQTTNESEKVLERLIKLASNNRNRVYLDTMISPSYTSAIAQVVQLSGISGKPNNMILFEFSRSEPEAFVKALENYSLIHSAGFDVCVLNSSYKAFGDKREIHVWVTSYDFENANLMILLAYILLGHPEWRKGEIKIFALYEEGEFEKKQQHMLDLIKSGRLPISAGNVKLIPVNKERNTRQLIMANSIDADLTVVGFRHELVKAKGIEVFTGYEDIGNILFVSSQKEKEIS